MTMIRICAVVLVVGATACTKNSTAPTTTPATATRTTDTFSGTVQVGGRDFRGFTVSQTGQVDVTLTSAGPPSTIVMGLAVGLPGDATCAPLAGASTMTQAGTAAQLSGTTSAATLCVQVYDLGNQTAPVSYTVTVTHP
jgi:hypothetical protein